MTKYKYCKSIGHSKCTECGCYPAKRVDPKIVEEVKQEWNIHYSKE